MYNFKISILSASLRPPKRQDDIVVANMVADMEVNKVADMEVDKVADEVINMLASMEVDKVANMSCSNLVTGSRGSTFF